MKTNPWTYKIKNLNREKIIGSLYERVYMFIVLLRFSESLAHDRTKFLFLNDEPCLVRRTFIDLSPAHD